MAKKTAIVLHLVPLPAFADRDLYDIVGAMERGTHFPLPLGATGNQWFVNLDGVVNYNGSEDYIGSYAQLFRSTAIEGVATMQEASGHPAFEGIAFANMIVGAARQYVDVIRSLEGGLPIFVMLSLCGAERCHMRYEIQPGAGWMLSRVLNRSVLSLPEVTLLGDGDDPAVILRPVFNMLWNAFGFLRSPMYNQSGEWIGVA